MDTGPEMNSKQRRVGDEYAMSGMRLQTSLPPPHRGGYLPELPVASRASCHLKSFVLAAAGAFDLQSL